MNLKQIVLLQSKCTTQCDQKPTAINSLTQEANNQKTLIGNDGNATDDEKRLQSN